MTNAAKIPRPHRVLAYPSHCVICGASVTLLSQGARAKARKRGYSYCPSPAYAPLGARTECGKAGKSVRMTAWATARYKDPAERERGSVIATARYKDPAELVKLSAAQKVRRAREACLS